MKTSQFSVKKEDAVKEEKGCNEIDNLHQDLQFKREDAIEKEKTCNEIDSNIVFPMKKEDAVEMKDICNNAAKGSYLSARLFALRPARLIF